MLFEYHDTAAGALRVCSFTFHVLVKKKLQTNVVQRLLSIFQLLK